MLIRLWHNGKMNLLFLLSGLDRGKGVRAAAVSHMGEAWWGPTIVLPGEDQARMLVIEKNLPHSMMVKVLTKLTGLGRGWARSRA